MNKRILNVSYKGSLITVVGINGNRNRSKVAGIQLHKYIIGMNVYEWKLIRTLIIIRFLDRDLYR